MHYVMHYVLPVRQVLRLFGFGPVVADGFGIGYIIKASRTQ